MGVNALSIILLIEFHLPLRDPVLIFSLVLFIILLAPIVLRKLRIPSIIGLIVAGVIIGPNGFNILMRDSSIELFGTVGLLYIMFLAGLELDMDDFRKNRLRSIMFGLLTLVIPIGIGFLLTYYFFGFSLLSAVLTASLITSHTLLAYPIISRFGLTKNKAVIVAVGGTIITDTIVLLLLSFIINANAGKLDQHYIIQLGISLIIFAFVIFWAFPRIGKWFFKSFKEDSTSHFIFVLAMVFLGAFFAELAGLEALIGAFVAGLSLNRLIPNTSPLKNRLEFVGNAIFIPFFLIKVGMMVDVKVLFSGYKALELAGGLLLGSFLAKNIAAFFIQKICGFDGLQRKVIYGLSGAHASATLAVVLVGFRAGLLSEDVLNAAVILILGSSFIASFTAERAGRKLAILEADKVPEIDEEPEKIIVPISKPGTIESLIDLAIMIKNRRSSNPIYPLTVVKDDEEAREKVMISNKLLEKAVIHASATETKLQVITRVDLNIASGIDRAVKEIMATDLIMGWSDKKTTSEKIFGTTLSGILYRVWQTIYVGRFIHPLNTTKKIVLVIPQNAEYEKGCRHWVKKVNELAKEAGAGIMVYASEESFEKFLEYINNPKTSVSITHERLEELEDFLILARELNSDDLLIVISARRGTLSYQKYLDTITSKMHKYFKDNNFILIYPEQAVVRQEGLMDVEGYSLAPLPDQLESFGKLGKAVKKIFNKGD